MCGAWDRLRPCASCRARKEKGKQQRNRELGRNTSAWQRFRERILERDQHTCRDCNTKPYQPHVHRIGGGKHTTHDPERYLTLCPGCHTARQRKENLELGLTR